MNDKIYESVNNFRHSQRMALSEKQAETLTQVESYYERHCKNIFDYIKEQRATDECIELDYKDFQILAFLSDDLENLFSVLNKGE